MQFTGPDEALERAIEADDPNAVDAALAAGANANARGTHGVTPLAYAVGTFRKRAAKALIARGADPNLVDAEGDNAVTLAVVAYARDPELLALVLDAGGDPNSRRPDGSPAIAYFCSARNLDAVTYLHRRGASLDVRHRGEPMVVAYAYSVDWDVVRHLIELGASIDPPEVRDGLVFAFREPTVPAPDGSVYPDKVWVWRYLKARGLDPVPPVGVTG